MGVLYINVCNATYAGIHYNSSNVSFTLARLPYV